jgi:hypothetical protein
MIDNEEKEDEIYEEDIIPYECDHFDIRIWFNTELMDKFTNCRVDKEIEEFKKIDSRMTYFTPRFLALMLLKIPEANAVEVIFKGNRDGKVLYKNWP